jgi:glyoxylase-like metal-dependent hydrolase (beta-lactamase superfamily II)
MIEPSSDVQYMSYLARRPPPVEELLPGLWSMPVRLVPTALRYVLTYVLRTHDGLILVDTGWPDDESWDALEAGLQEIGHAVEDVCGVLLTHGHPDHHGLADRVRQRSGAWVALHSADAAGDGGSESETLSTLEGKGDLDASGVPSAVAEAMLASFADRDRLRTFATPRADIHLSAGQTISGDEWKIEVIPTPGHTPGHTCFWLPEQRLLMTGDHVLPRITSHVGRRRGIPHDPLGDYLDSIDRVAALDPVEILPAHQYRFRDAQARFSEIRAHHQRRLDELLGKLSKRAHGDTAWSLTQRLTWSRPWADTPPWMQRAALAETFAHLLRLQVLGQVSCEPGSIQRWFRVH